MKRKLIILICLATIAASVVGCGKLSAGIEALKDCFFGKGKTPAALNVTIDGHTYSLSEDPHEVIGDMVKNGILVVDWMAEPDTYNEYGYLETEKDKKISFSEFDNYENHVFWCGDRYAHNPCPIETYKYHLSCCQYGFIGRSSAFETGESISDASTQSDMEKLSGYFPYHGGSINYDSNGYVAVYFDAEQVNLEQYKQDIDDFCLEMFENSGLDPDDPNKVWYYYDINCLIGKSRFAHADYNYNFWDTVDLDRFSSEIAVTRALWDGAQKLKDGEIENLCAVLYVVDDYYGSCCNIFIYSDKMVFLGKKEE